MLLAERFDDAVAEARAVIELEPAFPLGYTIFGGALLELARHEDEIDACRQTVMPADLNVVFSFRPLRSDPRFQALPLD